LGEKGMSELADQKSLSTEIANRQNKFEATEKKIQVIERKISSLLNTEIYNIIEQAYQNVKDDITFKQDMIERSNVLDASKNKLTLTFHANKLKVMR
jgi:hypothetical protein